MSEFNCAADRAQNNGHGVTRQKIAPLVSGTGLRVCSAQEAYGLFFHSFLSKNQP